jgi:hypothetical protein
MPKKKIREQALTRFVIIEKFPKPHKVEKGNKMWFDSNGELHSKNGFPGKILSNGTRIWYKHGLVHREYDLPAIVKFNGTHEWYFEGVFHRGNDLPAHIGCNGTKIWMENGGYGRKDSGKPYMITKKRYYFAKTYNFKAMKNKMVLTHSEEIKNYKGKKF